MGILDTLSPNQPLNSGQEAAVSNKFVSWFSKKTKNTLNSEYTEYCDRCYTVRYRGAKNRLVCNCPPE